MTQSSGQIIKSHGRRYVVEASDGRRYDCTTRGKRTDYACGDRVDLLIHNDEQAVIERAQPRRSLLYRQDDFRQKLIAANVTQLVVVLAAVPTPAPEFLDRCLIAAEASDIATLIVLNKCDLPQTAGLRTSLGFYREIGYDVLELSALGDISALRARLAGHTSVLASMVGLRLPIQSHPLQALVSELLEPVHPTVVMSNAVHVYVSQAHKGELVMGASLDPYEVHATRSTLDFVEHLSGQMLNMFPFLSNVKVMRQWAGMADMTPDFAPIMGKTPVEGFYLDAGWGTWGFKATPVSGKTMAHTVATGQPHPLITGFSLDRFRQYALTGEKGAASVGH